MGRRWIGFGGSGSRSAVVSAAVLIACTGSVAQQLSFTDQTASSGIDARYTQVGGIYTQRMLGGGAVGDFNRDGWPDLFCLSGGPEQDRLYINNGDGTFTERGAAWGVNLSHVGGGAAVGDYNADGWPDLFVTSLGPPGIAPAPGRHLLYRNNGDGTFSEVADDAGVNKTGLLPSGTGAAFGDYDLDGDLDLFVAGWDIGALGNRLFRNEGDGTFTDATASLAGVDMRILRGFTPVFADMDGDRYPEILLAADFETSAYWVNNRDGTFTGLARSQTGLDQDCFGMGAVVADIDGDGLLDWFISNIFDEENPTSPYYMCGQTLYINQGQAHQYVDIAPQAGVEDGGWGWGTDAVDLDNDGDLDLAQTNGWPDDLIGRFEQAPTRLWRNEGGGVFTEIAQSVGFDDRGMGRTLVTLDYDRDNDVDIVVFNSDGPVKLFRNELADDGAGAVRIVLDTSLRPDLAPDGFGSRIRVVAGGKTQHRYVDGGSTLMGVSELTEHVGIGASSSADEIRVTWQDGSETVLQSVPAGTEVTIEPPRDCTLADLDGDGWPDWGNFDVNDDGRIDINDLHAIHRIPTDVTGDGVVGPEEKACLEAFLRRNERDDMTAGRR